MSYPKSAIGDLKIGDSHTPPTPKSFRCSSFPLMPEQTNALVQHVSFLVTTGVKNIKYGRKILHELVWGTARPVMTTNEVITYSNNRVRIFHDDILNILNTHLKYSSHKYTNFTKKISFNVRINFLVQ
jgi:hypothetical protein